MFILVSIRLVQNPKQFIGNLASPILEIYHIYKKLFLSLQKSQSLSEVSEKYSLKADTKV